MLSIDISFPMFSSAKTSTSPILLRLPKTFKKSLQRRAKSTGMSQYIFEAIRERMAREERKEWIMDYLKSGENMTFESPDRNWPADRFYSPKKP